MKKMQLFEPAMCCPTGICGVGVDPELLRISAVLNALKNNGFEVDRFNLTSAPMEFIKNKAINDLLSSKGVDALPAALLDGKIIITGRYPSNEEFSQHLNIPVSQLSEPKKLLNTLPKNPGCGCPDGDCC
ncbi:Arsenical resistance operon trans-acting repressor ArsD [Desulfitobacterium hafniense DCB-2]|uniref:Arsenical resistance operon trans-acting repressor ArsD n=1 Tax=Desulfitobacterium hafniense (strain DSM 10664 / DCB-2) TaxID=272564 RepID=B8G133_DESHD|nr:arsenite efflux transporter metallochaperone ArsD [Desulfitobacterium hafniense]ACL19248.1 Arsenical resistance operon trans-acting repressor ArsD [Desulfitobacterium hafniense DCB-2]